MPHPVTFLTAGTAWGGTELHTLATATALGARGIDTVVVQLGHDMYQDNRSATMASGVRLELRPPGRELTTTDWSALLGQHPGPVVQVKGGFGLRWPTLDRVVRQSGRPLLRVEHSMPPPPRRIPWASPRFAMNLRLHRQGASRIMGVAASIRDRLVTDYGYVADRVDVITNGVDADRFAPNATSRATTRRTLGIGPTDFVFGAVVRFDPVKRLDVLLRAFELSTRDELTPSHLVLAGNGPEEPSLRALATELGLAGRCHWVGWVDDVAALLPAFDVFCITSEREGTTYAVLEAMATGLPVIATPVGGLPSVISHGETGLLVAGAPQQIGAAMAEVRSWPESRRLAAGVISRELVVARHNAARQADAVADWITTWGG